MSLAWFKQLWQMGLLPAGVGRAALDMDLPIFDVELIDSLVPRRAGGIATPTFTRADGANGRATVLGYAANATIADGPTILTVNADEARIMGARRIAANQWSRYDANGIPLVTGAGASSLCCDAYGPFGYLSEGSRTNRALQSTFAASWSPTLMQAVDANQYVAPDGTTSMAKLTCTSATGAHYVAQTTGYTFTAAPHTFSCYLRYVNKQWATLYAYDGTTIYVAVFDVLNGVKGNVSAAGGSYGTATSTMYETSLPGVYFCSVTFTPAAAGAYVFVGLNNSNSATQESWTAAGGEALGVWGAQLEAASFPSAYIPTTNAAVTRAADSLTYAGAGNISDTAGTCYAEIASSNYDANSRVIGSNGSGSTPLFIASSTAIGMYNGTDSTRTASSATLSNGQVHKAGSAWGADWFCALDGTVSAAAAITVGVLGGGSQINIGHFSGGNQPFCTIRNVRIYRRDLSVDRMRALTT